MPLVTTCGAPRRVTLPGLLANLAEYDELELPRVRPHQAPALHAFLVQLAYLALERSDDAPPPDEGAWKQLLRALTPQWPDDEPWQLVVDDPERPAFLQPPAVAGERGPFPKAVVTPDALDVLVTGRNHDIKKQRMRDRVDISDWVLALITLQTFDGYLGRGNFGVVRMNGGFASRPQFRLAFQRGWGAEFRRDIARLREGTEELWRAAEAAGVATATDPVRLAWLEPWDGKSSWSLQRLHPLGIEICRRVRLHREGGAVAAKAGNSECARVDAGETRGAVGDPWVPLEIVDADEVKALTATPETLGYRRLAELLFDASRYRIPLLARPGRDERSRVATLIAQVLVRGQGKTEGFHRRELSLPPAVVRRLADRDSTLAQRSRQFLQVAGTVHGKVLRPALIQFVDGSAEPNWRNPQYETLVKPTMRQAEQLTDSAFFNALFESIEQELSDEEAERAWGERLATQASEVFAAAIAALPTGGQTRIIAAARAQSLLESGLRKHVASRRLTIQAN